MAEQRPTLDAEDQTPVYVISVAAELAGMHAQTLRQYDRLGLVTPSRTRGGVRRYSARDVALLREVQRLSQDEGISLPGIARILQLENQVAALQERVAELSAELETRRRGIPDAAQNAACGFAARFFYRGDRCGGGPAVGAASGAALGELHFHCTAFFLCICGCSAAPAARGKRVFPV